MDAKTAYAIIKQLNDNDNTLDYGIRAVPADYAIGDTMPNSYVWAGDDELAPTEEEAAGACVMDGGLRWDNGSFACAWDDFAKDYLRDGNRVYIVAGERTLGGDWCHHWYECMIVEPVVVAVIS